MAGTWKKEGAHKRETCSLSPRMSLSRTPVLSCTHYFQAPAKQFKKSQKLQSTLAFSCLAIRQRKNKTSQHNSRPLIFTLSIMLTKKKWLNCHYQHSKGLGFVWKGWCTVTLAQNCASAKIDNIRWRVMGKRKKVLVFAGNMYVTLDKILIVLS